MSHNENLELAKLAISIATPIVIAVIGLLLLRRIEGVKAVVAKQSEFDKKWAEQFFESCQAFMQAVEKELAFLKQLSELDDAKGLIRERLIKEINKLRLPLMELQLRIRRSVVFAPSSGSAVTKASAECLSLLANLLSTGRGNADEIIDVMNSFNEASRKAHAEMLGLSSKRPPQT